MEPPTWVNKFYDLGLGSQGEIFEQDAMRSESVRGVGPGEEEEGHVQEGDPGLMGDIHHEGDQEGDNDQEGDVGQEGENDREGHGNQEGGGGDQEPGQQLAEMAQGAAAAAPQPQNPRRRVQRRKFTPGQVRELESIYQHTQYPDMVTRRDIARRIGDTEDRVQVWFKNKRAKFWRNERLSRMRNALPATLNHLYFTVLERP